MMADDVLARATVAISADVKDFDVAMGLLPAKSQKAIKKSIDAIKLEMAKVGGAIGSATNLADVQKLSDYYAKLQKSLDGVKLSAISQAASLGDVGKAATINGNKMQVFAQTLDDLQYVPEMGLRPILNNLIQISPALGVAGLVLQQFISHWDDLTRLVGQGRVKTQAEEMEELGKKTEKTAEETARLLGYETRRKNLDSQRGPTDSKVASTGRVNDAIRESREVTVRQAIDAIHGPAIRNSIDSNVEDNLARAKARSEAADNRARSIAEHPMAHPENAQRARWDADRMKEKLVEAQKAWDTAYSEGRDKIQGNLTEDVAALKSFIKDAEKNRLLGRAALDRLKEAAKSDEERDIEASDAYYDKQEADRASHMAELAEQERVRKRDEDEAADEYYRRQDMDLASRDAEHGENRRVEQRDKDQAKVAPLQDKLIPGLLEKIAKGEEVNQERLSHTIEDRIAGLSIKDPTSAASNLASKTLEDLNAQIARRQLEKGGTREQASAAIYGERLNQLKAEAQQNRPSLGVTDLESFHREAQDSLIKGSSNEALIEEQKRLTEAVAAATKSQDEMTKALKDQKGIVLR